MPLPFHCIECDKPVSIPMRGLCDNSQRHREEMVRELNDLSDVMMEVKGSVSRINGKH